MRLGLLALSLLMLVAIPTTAEAARIYVPLSTGGTGAAAPTPTATPLPTAATLPTATPVPTATPAPDPKSDIAFVFLSGLRTSSATDTFAPVKRQLRLRGYSPAQFIDYSYRPDGPYVCSDTYQDPATSYAVLRDQLAAYRATHPRARFVLVGHSLGGLIGWLQLGIDLIDGVQRDALGVVGVVTADAPLIGVGSGKSTLLDSFVACNFSRAAEGLYPATLYLDALHNSPDAVRTTRNAEAARAAALGIRALTVGSDDDCVYLPTLCAILGVFSDDRETQYVYGYERRVRAGGITFLNPAPSHGAIVNSYPGWLADLVEWAAQPR
jgi:pimeloyl-ACP methyl ester carboxylesterase